MRLYTDILNMDTKFNELDSKSMKHEPIPGLGSCTAPCHKNPNCVQTDEIRTTITF